MLTTPDKIRTLQRKLYIKAKQEPGFRFYALYDKLMRADILSHAYKLVRAKKGAPGVDGRTFEAIEAQGGKKQFLAHLRDELAYKTYRANAVRRVWIPKPDGSKRPLGIPTIRDRVVQAAAKIVIEPIFEADFCEHSYGFRPKRSAHDAVDAVAAVQRDFADFYWIYYGWQGVHAELAGIEFDYLPLIDLATVLDYYTPLVLTSEGLIAEDPALVERFVQALARGYVYATIHPSEAADIWSTTKTRKLGGVLTLVAAPFLHPSGTLGRALPWGSD